MFRIASAALFAALFPSIPVSAQSFAGDISLSGLGNGSSAKPFGLAADPASSRLWIAVAGDFMGNNNVVAEIDTTTDTVVRTIPVGLYPEDIVLIADASTGLPTIGAVTNSTSGSVTLWDLASGVVTATIPLPDLFGIGSCYPFGIVAGGPGLYVTTVDGSGSVFAIDLATNAVDTAASLSVGWQSCGRPVMAQDTVIVPTTQYNATWSGSEGGLSGLDPTGNNSWALALAAADNNGSYPSGMDILALSNGDLVASGLDLGGRLYLLDGQGNLKRTIRLSQQGGAHGIAVSADETLLAACDLASNSVALVDLLSWQEISVINLASTGLGYALPNDVAFVGGKLYVTCQGSEEVVIFDNLPSATPGTGYAGLLTVSDTTPKAGNSLTITVAGPGVVALLVSFDDIPGSFNNVGFQLGLNPHLVGWRTASFGQTWNIPPFAPRGMNLFAQGAVDVTNAPLVTEPQVLVIQ